MSLQGPDKIRTLQRKLYRKAKAEPAFRVYVLYDNICCDNILHHAYRLAHANAGSPGVNKMTFERIEAAGAQEWLAGMREELGSRTYRPHPVRRVMLPKPGVAKGRSEFRLFGIVLSRLRPSLCLNQSSRRI